ncbi:MAG TPA: GspH/FimT family pseudopilin [Casimicrobiaceae bacterium]
MMHAPRSAAQGISLIEMMITVALFVILALMAFPLYTTWIASQQVRTATEAVLDGLRVTQAEAVKRNSAVSFVLTSGTGWQATLVSDGSVLREALFSEGSLKVKFAATPAGTTTVIFDGLGRVLDSGGAPLTARVTWDVDSSKISTGVRKLRVVVDTAAATGVGIKSCDPKLSGDPRACP